jgi:hypothetical protein
MHIGRTAIAWQRGAAAFVISVGLGAGVVSQHETPTPAVLASGETPADGTLPVIPDGGGACIIGLNCGCIRGITCPGTVHHRPAPATGHPHDAPSGPDGGG